MTEPLTLYSAKGSGGVAIEAALTLVGLPYQVVDSFDWSGDPHDGEKVLAANPMRQVPALVLPGGEILTESAAILIWLAEQHPDARLAPAPGSAGRAQFLRWMAYVSSAIYSLYWVKDEPSRLAPDPAAQPALVERSHDRIADCWRMMGEQVAPGAYILGDELSVLDLYVAVVSRFKPRRRRLYAVAPNLEGPVRRVDADPRLQALWAERMPFVDGWEG